MQNLVNAAEKLSNKGFLDLEIDPTLDLVAEINKLKKFKSKNTCISSYFGFGRYLI